MIQDWHATGIKFAICWGWGEPNVDEKYKECSIVDCGHHPRIVLGLLPFELFSNSLPVYRISKSVKIGLNQNKFKIVS